MDRILQVPAATQPHTPLPACLPWGPGASALTLLRTPPGSFPPQALPGLPLLAGALGSGIAGASLLPPSGRPAALHPARDPESHQAGLSLPGHVPGLCCQSGLNREPDRTAGTLVPTPGRLSALGSRARAHSCGGRGPAGSALWGRTALWDVSTEIRTATSKDPHTASLGSHIPTRVCATKRHLRAKSKRMLRQNAQDFKLKLPACRVTGQMTPTVLDAAPHLVLGGSPGCCVHTPSAHSSGWCV